MNEDQQIGQLQARVENLHESVNRLERRMDVGFDEMKALLAPLTTRVHAVETAQAEDRGARRVVVWVFGLLQGLVLAAVGWLFSGHK